MTDRLDPARSFARENHADVAGMAIIAGDASHRKYYRLPWRGRTAILMDSPPDKGEDIRPFIAIADWLRQAGLSAPEIYALDDVHGFALIEDLGDDLFARVLASDPGQEHDLYTAAIDVLLATAQTKPPPLARYDAATMAPLAALAVDWYHRGIFGERDIGLYEGLSAEMQRRLRPFDSQATHLIQRDFHAENLIWLPERSGVARVGLLDFQDAMLGHPAYDLVSILRDVRRDVSSNTEREGVAQFTHGMSLDRAEFSTAYAMLSLQRNLRILGVFARLCLRDGKTSYLALIPRVWAHIGRSLDELEDRNISALIRENLPEPTETILSDLREKCATVPHP